MKVGYKHPAPRFKLPLRGHFFAAASAKKRRLLIWNSRWCRVSCLARPGAPELTVDGGPRFRIRLPPAESRQTFGPSRVVGDHVTEFARDCPLQRRVRANSTPGDGAFARFRRP